MNVYLLLADSNSYETLMPVKEADWDAFQPFDGRALAGQWTPVAVEIDREPCLGKMPKPCDFPSVVTRAPVFSARAVDALGDLLRPYGELLPLRCRDGEYFAFNVTPLADALDEAASEIERFPTGRIMFVDRYAFRPEKIDAPIFKLPQMADRGAFVTEAFVERARQAQLQGFLFEQIWP